MPVARDIMQTDVVTIEADAPLLSAYRVFDREGISGAPVIDATENVVGVLSLRDLVRASEDQHDLAQYDLQYYSDTSNFEVTEWLGEVEGFEDRLSERRVGDFMTAGVISVSPEASISEVAKKILENRVHRVLVIDEDAKGVPLLGLISVFDLVPLLV